MADATFDKIVKKYKKRMEDFEQNQGLSWSVFVSYAIWDEVCEALALKFDKEGLVNSAAHARSYKYNE